MFIWLVTIPLTNVILCLFFGRLLGRKGCIYSTIFLYSFVCFYLCTVYCFYLTKGVVVYTPLWVWLDNGLLYVKFELLFDSLSIIMCSLILTVSTVVHFYSIIYMKYDNHMQRFIAYLSLFTFFMIFLVTSSSLPMLFIGWEGIGIISYLLVSFWFFRIESCQSGLKAVIYNRIGDCCLLCFIAICFYFMKSLDFSIIFIVSEIITKDKQSYIDLLVLLLLVAALSKSAQFFLHSWLADAMEGPTPVSALMHAATLVIAGIFLFLRFSFFLELSNNTMLMALTGSITIFYASIVSIFQNDLKKIIAYSTCSQVGYMLLSCSCGGYSYALYHVIMHGFFKAFLFLIIGLLIHDLKEDQDLRKIGGLSKTHNFLYLCLVCSNMSLVGIPYLAGAGSKDSVLEYLLLKTQFSSYTWFCYWLSLTSISLTCVYSIRLFYWLFYSKPLGNKKNYYSNKNKSLFLMFNLLMLFIMSIIGGWLYSESIATLIGLSNNASSINVFPNNTYNMIKYKEFLIATVFIWYPVLGLVWGFCFFSLMQFQLSFITLKLLTKKPLYVIYVFIEQAWMLNRAFFNIISMCCNYLIVCVFLIEKSLGEQYGPFGFNKKTKLLSNIGKHVHYLPLTSYNYVLWFIIITIFYMITNIFW